MQTVSLLSSIVMVTLLGWATQVVAQPLGENSLLGTYTQTDSRWSFSVGTGITFINDDQDNGLVQRYWLWQDPEFGYEYFRWQSDPAYSIEIGTRFRAFKGLGISLTYEHVQRDWDLQTGGPTGSIEGRGEFEITFTPGTLSGFWQKATSWRLGLDYEFDQLKGYKQKTLSIFPSVELSIDQYYHNRFRQHNTVSHTSLGLNINGTNKYVTEVDAALRTRYGNGATWYPSLRLGLAVQQQLSPRANVYFRVGGRFNAFGLGLMSNVIELNNISHVQNYPYSALEADGDLIFAEPRRVVHEDVEIPAYIGGLTLSIGYVHQLQRFRKG